MMLENWQIALVLIAFLTLVDWCVYLFLSYWSYATKPKYLGSSLLIPLGTGALLFLLFAKSNAVSFNVAMTFTILTVSFIPYFVLFHIDYHNSLTDEVNHSKPKRSISGFQGTCIGITVTLLQFVPLGAYAKNINEYSFEREASKVKFPTFLCHPESICTVLDGNELKYQVWSEYSSFETKVKPVVIEITSGGFTDDLLKNARLGMSKKHATFPILKFECDKNYTEYDQWILIKASSVTLLEVN